MSNKAVIAKESFAKSATLSPLLIVKDRLVNKGVPSSVLSPRTTWGNDEAYYNTAFKLSTAFRKNFQQFEEFANEEIRRGGPQRYAF